MAELSAHRLAEVYPLIEGPAFEDLKANIAAEGQILDIVLFEGKILDGRNRYRACLELGIEPRFVEYTGDTPANRAWGLNSSRRDLTKDIRALISLTLLPEIQAEAKSRQLATLKQGSEVPDKEHVPEREEVQASEGQARDIAGKRVGVSGKLVDWAKAVSAVRPDLAEQVRAGKIKLRAAYNRLRPKKEKPTSAKPAENEADRRGLLKRLLDLVRRLDSAGLKALLSRAEELANATD